MEVCLWGATPAAKRVVAHISHSSEVDLFEKVHTEQFHSNATAEATGMKERGA
jgi:hypothetical protein